MYKTILIKDSTYRNELIKRYSQSLCIVPESVAVRYHCDHLQQPCVEMSKDPRPDDQRGQYRFSIILQHTKYYHIYRPNKKISDDVIYSLQL